MTRKKKLKQKIIGLKEYCSALQTAYTNAKFDNEELKKNLKQAPPEAPSVRSHFYNDHLGKPKKIAVTNMEVGSQLLDALKEFIAEFGNVTVADLNDMLGYATATEETKYGWTSLRDAFVESSKGETFVILPNPQELKERPMIKKDKIVQKIFPLETKKAAEAMRDYLIDAIKRNGAVSVHEALFWLDRPVEESDYNIGWTNFDEFRIHYSEGIGYILSLPEPVKLNSGTQKKKLLDDARIKQASSDYNKAQLSYMRVGEKGLSEGEIDMAKMKARAAFDFLLHTIEEVSKERNVKNGE